MSAFIVTKQHIDYIVHFCTRGGRDSVRYKRSNTSNIVSELTPSQLGQELWAHNVMSVNSRYSNSKEDIPERYEFRFKPTLHTNALQCLKALKCLNYQTCELESYESTAAYRLIQSLINQCVSRLDGYDDAEWSL